MLFGELGRLLNVEHLVTLAVIAACIAALVTAARLSPGAWTVAASRALAVLIVANECGWWVWLGLQHTRSARYALPPPLCDIVAFVAAAPPLARRPPLLALPHL